MLSMPMLGLVLKGAALGWMRRGVVLVMRVIVHVYVRGRDWVWH